MGIIVRQEDNSSKLQEKVQAELRDKARRQPMPSDDIDGVEDSRYVEGMKKTTSLAWLWVIVIVAGMALLVLVVALSARA